MEIQVVFEGCQIKLLKLLLIIFMIIIIIIINYNNNDNNNSNDNNNNNNNNNNDGDNDLYFKRVTQSNSTLIFPVALSIYKTIMVPQPSGHTVTK